MKKIIRGALMACVVAFGHYAVAQDQKPVTARIVVGNQPGGSTDTVARLLGTALSASLNRNFVVENRAGASGNIAAEHVARSTPDGNTILLIFNSHTTAAPLFPNLKFDPIGDFSPVGLISHAPYFVVARPDIEAKDLKDLIETTRARKGVINAGTPGIGTPQHLLLELVKKVNDVDINAIHYKGSAPAQMDVIGGHVDITLVTPTMAVPQLKAGKLKLLAVTSDARIPEFPDVPTVREAGVDSLSSSGVWIALLVPAKTPGEIVAKLNKALNDALQEPEVIGKLQAVGMAPIGGTPEQLGELLRKEQAMWTTLIRESKITADD